MLMCVHLCFKNKTKNKYGWKYSKNKEELKVDNVEQTEQLWNVK